MDDVIMKTGLVDYQQWNKPVKYTEEFLQSLTGDVAYDVNAEHNGGKLTQTNSLYMKNGELYASFDEDVSLEDYGYSTTMYFDMAEYDDYYVPIVGSAKIYSVDRVANPKMWNTCVWNSEDNPKIEDKTTKDKGENVMSDELQGKIEENGALKEKLNTQIRRGDELKENYDKLKEVSDKQSSQMEELTKEHAKELKKLQEKLKANDELIKQYQQKEKDAKYNLAKSVAESRVAKDTPDREDKVNNLINELSDLSDDALEMLNSVNNSNNHKNTTPKGVGASVQGAYDEKLPSEPKEIDGSSTVEEINESLRRKGFNISR